MTTLTATLKDADRMVSQAEAREDGVAILFADGCRGFIPFSDLPEIGSLANLEEVALPNPYEIRLRTREDEVVELPWDFARAYCDPSYRPRAETAAQVGRKALGARLQSLRTQAGLTQERVAERAGISRVTLTRIENGEQSPRYETLLSLAQALGLDPAELLRPEELSRKPA